MQFKRAFTSAEKLGISGVSESFSVKINSFTGLSAKIMLIYTKNAQKMYEMKSMTRTIGRVAQNKFKKETKHF